MQEVYTTPGKTYSVHTANGCTVSDDSGWSKAIDAPDGYFTAHGSTVYLSDDAATLREVFKLAPQQKLALLGVLGGNDSLPAGYTRVAWLESPSTVEQNVPALFSVPINLTPVLDSLCVVSEHFVPLTIAESVLQQEGIGKQLATLSTFGWSANLKSFFISFDGNNGQLSDTSLRFDCPQEEWVVYKTEKNPEGITLEINGEKKAEAHVPSWSDTNCQAIGCFGRVGMETYSPYGLYGRKKWWKLYKNNVLQNHLVPCLDEVGSPCMYDLVTKTTFYNVGTGEFSYPGKETEVSTFTLRRPVTYAQLTEHGVRRLYRVPRGYNGTKEEYAAEHGFKPLVETPQPEEGYWAPEWRESEEEIVLDWVETEPPTEENDETLT